MKTMSDFKGSKEDFKLLEIKQDDCFELKNSNNDRTIAVVNYWDGRRLEAQANAKLFANSKTVLEMLIKARKNLYMDKITLAAARKLSLSDAIEYANNHEHIKEIDNVIENSL